MRLDSMAQRPASYVPRCAKQNTPPSAHGRGNCEFGADL